MMQSSLEEIVLDIPVALPISDDTVRDRESIEPEPASSFDAQQQQANNENTNQHASKLLSVVVLGEDVETPYGSGKVIEYREIDGMYAIKLNRFGGSSGSGSATLYSTQAKAMSEAKKKLLAKNEVMKLNIAYQALEQMRRLNLEMECFDAGITQVDYEQCKTCLLEKKEPSHFPRLQKFVDEPTWAESSVPRFPRLHNLWGASTSSKSTPLDAKPKPTVVLPRIQKLMDNRQKALASPCLICANKCCSTHSSTIFRKEGITLCHSCERLFELNFIVDCVSTADAAERSQHIDHMIDLYDRSLLLLRYSSQFIETIARNLDEKKEQHNKIGLGSSGAGVVSGVLGLAAAATILTPAGPPLLIASLFFGGSASSVQMGSDALNHFSEPRQLADRIIALHGMIHSILRVTSTLRDAMLRDHIRTDAYLAEGQPLTAEQMQTAIEKNKAAVLVGANVSRSVTLGGIAALETGAVAGAEATVIGARASTALSRAGTAAARTVRFARFAGGALSAAVLVLEANAIQKTLKSIRAGNPCDKADMIRRIQKELDEGQLPSTSSLDEECQAYLSTLEHRRYPPAEPPVARAVPLSPEHSMEPELTIMPEQNATQDTTPTMAEDLCQAGATIVDGEDMQAPPDGEAGDENNQALLPAAQQQQTPQEQSQSTASSLSFSATGSSLLERIQMHKTRQGQQSATSQWDSEESCEEPGRTTVVQDQKLRDAELNLVI
jgi:hypothetical protein